MNGPLVDYISQLFETYLCILRYIYLFKGNNDSLSLISF